MIENGLLARSRQLPTRARLVLPALPQAQRLDIFSGPGTTALVAGSGFVITTGSDPAVTRWQDEGARTCSTTWSGDYSKVVPAEQRDGYIGG